MSSLEALRNTDGVIFSLTDADQAVSLLVSLGDGHFGYGLRNGTIGVYNRYNRLWRIKSKPIPVCFASYDINQDGHQELICGWDNGKISIHITQIMFRPIQFSQYKM
ncbi:unnamed protein product [Echinostoma caproni]|uniref:BBS2_Mid domain-containing protein n=1 Tax=Echinostoma caproni TaxID=27848 RepID=A0A183AUE1_9TREM|nr:unnamed protein product [Echinostoma caproni]